MKGVSKASKLWLKYLLYFSHKNSDFSVILHHTVYRETFMRGKLDELSVKTFWWDKLWQIAAWNTKAPLIKLFYTMFIQWIE